MTKEALYRQILNCINQLQSLQYGTLSMKETEVLTQFEKEIVFLSYRSGMNLEAVDANQTVLNDNTSVAKEELFVAEDADKSEDDMLDGISDENKGMSDESGMSDKGMQDSLLATDDSDPENTENDPLVIPDDYTERVHNLDNDEDIAEGSASEAATEETIEEDNFDEVDQTEDTDVEVSVDLDEEDEADEEDVVVSADLDIEDEPEEGEETSPLISGMPSFHSMEETELFTDENRKSLLDFVYSRKMIAIKGEETASRAAIAERMVVSTFPLNVACDDGNAKIFVVVEHDGQMYHASSYDNNNGSSIVQMKIDGYELFVMGMWENYKFHTRIMTAGTTAADGIVVEEMEVVDNTPTKNRIKNGHIKFSYEDSGNDIGTIEVFPVSDSATKTHLFYIRKVDAFVDYGELGQRVVSINTIEGYKNLSVNVIQGELEISLISQEL